MKKSNPVAEQSKQWLAQSLFNLMEKQNYSEITITKISENAQLARRTFYRNFHSKEDVVIYSCTQLCESYMRYLGEGMEYSIRHIIRAYFTFWQEHIDYLTVLTDHHLACHLIDVSNGYWPQIYGRSREHWKADCSDKESECCLLFNMGGLWDPLMKRLYDENRETPPEMERMIHKLPHYSMKSIWMNYW